MSFPLAAAVEVESQVPMSVSESEVSSLLLEQNNNKTKTKSHLQNVVLVIEDNLDIRFKEYWYQEDIEQLYQLLHIHISEFQLIESLMGADRQTYRLSHNNQYLLLNFDYYSQSCWFSVEVASEQALLMNLLTKFSII